MSRLPGLKPLCREFDRERPNVLVVVGAGVSYGATGQARASWRGLLVHGVETLRNNGLWDDETANANLTLINRAFSAAFDLEEVLGRAESIARALGAHDGADYGKWLERAIGSLEADEGRAATLNAIKQLEQAGALILTTNYDDLLSDATGLDPVTWQDHREFLRVLNGDSEGVLHIHGHWRTPSSVILGRRSYEEIVATKELQDIFKSIWMHWSWLYVGCGNGLEDPNVGRLLRWGQETFVDSGRNHYFLAKEDIAEELAARADKPANLIPVGYSDHPDLPGHLMALAPRQRPAPFVKLGPEGGPLRLPSTSPLDVPLPSWQELLDGDVPPLTADSMVSTALGTHGWALVYDVASVGKTTLALRVAAAAERRGRQAFYLDIARVDASDEDEAAEIRAAARRLANTLALVVLDNAHWAPQLAREIWAWWLDRSRTSQLLMAATRIQYTAGVAGDDGLTVIERHLVNPAIAVKVLPADLSPVLNSIVKRIRGRDAALLPPTSALETWHASFAQEMGAFTAAVTNEHLRLGPGKWVLPLTAAAEWVHNRHLGKLDVEERENAICLAAFASQRLELDVTERALPHPGKVTTLLRGGLISRRELGRAKYRFYAFREPGWGLLMLAAIDPLLDTERVLLEAARRDVVLALGLGSRWSASRESNRLSSLWRSVLSPDVVAELGGQLVSLPLNYAREVLVRSARNAEQKLITGLWDELEKDPVRLAERAFETPLDLFGTFINTASAQGRTTLVTGLWEALEKDPVRLAERGFETPLHFLASFLNTALAQGRTALVAGVWEALEKDPVRLAERAFETPLDLFSTFINTASAQGRTALITGLWEALEKGPVRLAERAFETPLDLFGAFINTASAQGRTTLVTGLWEALEKDPMRLSERGFETPLHFLASFLNTASAQGRTTLVTGLWEALEKDPMRLSERGFKTPLHFLASFLNTASAQGRTALVTGLWEALEKDPVRLAERAFETPLDQFGTFINTASAQGRTALITGVWEALEKGPVRLAERAFETPLEHIGSFINTASAQGRTALVTGLWEALEKGPVRLAERAFETPLEHIGSFINTASAQGRTALVTGLWEALEKDPVRLAERAFETPLEHIGSFINTASAQGRTALVTGLWEALEKDPDWLQAASGSTDLSHLSAFLRRATASVGRIAIANIETAGWASGNGMAKAFWGAPRLATQFSTLGRDDLAAALRDLLLRTPDSNWFSAPYAALVDVAVLLNSVSKPEQHLVDPFLDRVCTRPWLDRQYLGKTNDETLAAALSLLAQLKPPSHIRRFWAPSLRKRIANLLAELPDAEGEDLSGAVQLLGATQLIGQRSPQAPLAAVRLDRIGRLPLDVLPHRPDAAVVEPKQMNLWMGLRVVASLAPARLQVGRNVIDETLERWLQSLAADGDATGTSRRLSESMSAWLEVSSRDGRGVLLPSREPLWLAAGFERDPGAG